MEAVKIVLYIAATVIMGGVELIVPGIAGSVAVFYVSILTSFLGLDIWGMIKTTSILPPGEYKELKVHRYVICACSYIVLIGIGYFISAIKNVDMAQMYNVFVSAVFVLIAMLIGGLEGNKIATGTTSASSEDKK